MRVSGRNNAFTPTVGEQINQIISNPGKYPRLRVERRQRHREVLRQRGVLQDLFQLQFVPRRQEPVERPPHRRTAARPALRRFGRFVDPRLRIWIKPRYVQYPSATEPDVIREMIGAVSGCTINYNGITSISEREPYLHYETLVATRAPTTCSTTTSCSSSRPKQR